jgi:hypothetical protein
VLRAALLGAAGLAVPVACGLPSGGGPIIDGPGPSPKPGDGDSDGRAPRPQDAVNEEDLVRKFFGAVAGKLDTDDDLKKASERAKAFLTDRIKGSWPALDQIAVVRVGNLSHSAGGVSQTLVQAPLTQVGIMQPNGTVKPVPGPLELQKLQFTVVANGAKPGWSIDKIETIDGQGPPLKGMLLDSGGLDGQWYSPQLVYFWSSGSGQVGLVPDLRYVPKAGLSKEAQRTEIVNWMLGGPSDLLAGTVQDVYQGITLVGPNLVAPDHDVLLVNLSAPPPRSVTLDQLRAQLRWSLQSFWDGSVRLQVNSQDQKVLPETDDWQVKNLADRPFRDGDGTAFCVVSGVVRPIANPDQLPPALTGPDNKGVRFAALSRDQRSAALVKADALHIGGVGGDGAKPAFRLVDLSGTQWTRPVFVPALPPSSPLVLVAVDGQLYVVFADGSSAEVAADRPLNAVSAFSVAPDGHRIALISGGVACVGALQIDGTNVAVGGLQNVDPGLSQLSGVAWSRLDRVLVAGKGSVSYQLAEITLDGAIANVWAGAYGSKITSVVALPYLPSQSTGTGLAMVQTQDNGAYNSWPSNPYSIVLKPGSPTPTPSAGGAPGSPDAPSNPFFLD